jgi:hypothetical protein
MNFDTRTIIDLIKFDQELLEDLRYTIAEEQRFSENIEQYDYDVFVDSVSPLLKDIIKSFMKNKLKDIGLPILKGMVSIENIDYKIFVNEIQKNNT